MERSGRRDTTSTRENSLLERSSNVGSVRGKSIIVPRMGWSCPLPIVRILSSNGAFRCSGRRNPGTRWARSESSFPPTGAGCWAGALHSFRLQKGLIFETMQLTAEVPVSLLWWLGPPTARERKLSLQRAPRLASGFRAEGVRGEEALHWESSVFRDGRAASGMVYAGRCYSLGR